MSGNFEKPKQIDDIRIAQAMAKEENNLRNNGRHNPEEIEHHVEQAGNWERRNIMLEGIAQKISGVLSPEEISLIRDDETSLEDLVQIMQKMNSPK